MGKRTNNDVQNITQISKDSATRTPVKKIRVNTGSPEREAVHVLHVTIIVLIFVVNQLTSMA
jgi:hypothetical protein